MFQPFFIIAFSSTQCVSNHFRFFHKKSYSHYTTAHHTSHHTTPHTTPHRTAPHTTSPRTAPHRTSLHPSSQVLLKKGANRLALNKKGRKPGDVFSPTVEDDKKDRIKVMLGMARLTAASTGATTAVASSGGARSGSAGGGLGVAGAKARGSGASGVGNGGMVGSAYRVEPVRTDTSSGVQVPLYNVSGLEGRQEGGGRREREGWRFWLVGWLVAFIYLWCFFWQAEVSGATQQALILDGSWTGYCEGGGEGERR